MNADNLTGSWKMCMRGFKELKNHDKIIELIKSGKLPKVIIDDKEVLVSVVLSNNAIISTLQVEHAFLKTICAQNQGSAPITKGGLSSEMLLNMSAGRSIKDAIKAFGLNASVGSVVACVVYDESLTTTEHLHTAWADLDHLFEGCECIEDTAVLDAHLEASYDPVALKKTFDVSLSKDCGEEERRKTVLSTLTKITCSSFLIN